MDRRDFPRAKLNGRNAETEIKEILRERALQPRQALANELNEMNQELRSKYGELSDSAKYIRADGDNRG